MLFKYTNNLQNRIELHNRTKRALSKQVKVLKVIMVKSESARNT